MIQSIDLSGLWKCKLDGDKLGLKHNYCEGGFEDTITLPGTTAEAKITEKGKELEDTTKNYPVGYLTEEYSFTGYAWFEKEFDITDDYSKLPMKLYLERTRISRVWIDGNYIGTCDSLCTPHSYDLEESLTVGKHKIVIMIDNSEYKTKGGHMTSPDTQTNWNGITGIMELRVYAPIYLSEVELYPSKLKKGVLIKAKLYNHYSDNKSVTLSVSADVLKNKEVAVSTETIPSASYTITAKDDISSLELFYRIDNPLTWDEFEPSLYTLEIAIQDKNLEDTWYGTFGYRQLIAGTKKFFINDIETFLRGKHDGLIFPLTGYAPTNVEDWLKVMSTAKNYGINHYRFHTCTPPEAAFIAADMLGIYMEPELPFWGTITDESNPEHNKEEQEYLINEGKRILKTFGNHPSFAMMSLGNELWGSKERLSEILRIYKDMDSRHLYTQGSNNFQFVPEILEEEDFFVGVRFDRDRLFRGSYAFCDAPLGHVQTKAPSTLVDYEEIIHPSIQQNVETATGEETITIQYHDHTATVKADSQTDVLIPNVPVLSHEIGQYETYPNFEEISKYTGVLKARNFEAFKKRLEDKGLGDLARAYFIASGKFAVQCYKEELEAALRTKNLAGFQLLDLQDFSGQGTALVGVLDAFMEEKKTVTAKEWRSFCSDAVLLGRFSSYVYTSNETFTSKVQLSYYRKDVMFLESVAWELRECNTIVPYSNAEALLNEADCTGFSDKVINSGSLTVSESVTNGVNDLGTITFDLPKTTKPTKLCFRMYIPETDIEKDYILWIYPNDINLTMNTQDSYTIYESPNTHNKVYIVSEYNSKVKELLSNGETVLYFPSEIKNGLPGFYCTDFWCYPMFRSISESMGKEVPVGTMGLLIDNTHKALEMFPSELYTTPQWYQIVTNSTSAILDEAPTDFRPIVQVIDNFERNHKLGLIYETKMSFDVTVLPGNLIICTSKLLDIVSLPEAKQLLYSLLSYATSGECNPSNIVNEAFIKGM